MTATTSQYRIERSYASDRQVLLLTKDQLQEIAADCDTWEELKKSLADLCAEYGADSFGALYSYKSADGQTIQHRWLDGCEIKPAKRIAPPFFAAFSVRLRSRRKINAVRHCVVG